MKKINLLCSIMIVSCVVISCKHNELLDPQKPNIIFIISDDQAYSDYSFMGHEHIETPHIDRLAAESLTFTKGYVTAPLCSPSLATMITGLYAFQHGVTGNDPVVEYEGTKNRHEVLAMDTIPANSYPVQRDNAYKILSANYYKNTLITEPLSDLGYHSFQTGKWWVGSAQDAGFDKGMTHGDYTRGGRHGDEGLKIAREGLDPIYDFIDEAESLDKPFFIWYAPFLPHTPHNPPKALEEKYLKVAPSPFVARYWAMVEWFDQTTGELLNHLSASGLDDNTIIVYTCDNGWIQSIDSKAYAPRSKRSSYEGGIRTPLMIKYPGKIEPRMNRENLVSNIDIVPTILNMLGVDMGTLPGIDILNQSELDNRSEVFVESYNHDITNIDNPSESILYKVAVGKEWKLILPNTNMVKKEATTRQERYLGYYSKEPQLFNLIEDPSESNNVASQYPAEVKRLTDKINTWWQP